MLLSLQPCSSNRQADRPRHDPHTALLIPQGSCPVGTTGPESRSGAGIRSTAARAGRTAHKREQEGVGKGMAVQMGRVASQGRG
jgi:hypothetical protein